MQAGVRRIGSDASALLGSGGWVRKHPYLFVGGAAALGAVLGPVLKRTLHSPSRAVRGIGRVLAPLGPGVRASAIAALVGLIREPKRTK